MRANRLRRLRVAFAWVRAHPWRTAAVTLVVGFVVLNVVAYRHAHAMLNYSAAAGPTPPPQALSAGRKLAVLLGGVTVPRPAVTRTPHDFAPAAETVRFPTADGVTLEAWVVAPPNPRGTVILFHGYAASRSSLLDQGRAFLDRGLAVVLVDFRGGGGSDGAATSLGYHEAADVAAAARYARGRGLPRPLVLYGQSMGGAAVLRAVAAAGVRPDGVVLESVFDRMRGTVGNRFRLMGLPAFPGADLLVFWGGVQIGCSGFAHNPADYACACTCPALVLHGADDQSATVADGRAVFDALAGPKEMMVFAGAGHVSLCRSDPGRWAEVVGAFLTTHVGRPPE